MKGITFKLIDNHQSRWKINMLDKKFDVHVNNRKYVIEPINL